MDPWGRQRRGNNVNIYEGDYNPYGRGGWPPRGGQPNITINETFIEEPFYPPPQPQYVQRVYGQPEGQMVIAGGRSEMAWRDREEFERLKREMEHEKWKKHMEEELEAKALKKREEEIKRAAEEKEMKKKAIEEWQAQKEKEKKEKEEMKKKAIEEWQAEQAKKEKEKKDKEKEKEEAGQEYLRIQLRRENWTEEEIDEVIKHKHKHVSPGALVIRDTKKIMRVKSTVISEEVLKEYGIEYEYEHPHDRSYLIIYRSLDDREQQILIDRTHERREKKKLKEFAEVEETIVVKGVQKDSRGHLFLARKKERAKSPSRVKKTFFI